MTTTDDSKVVALIQQWEVAMKAGQRDNAERLLQQVHALAPEHAQVLNASGVDQLNRGNLEQAQALLERAIAQDGANPAFWINLASTLRRLNRREDELRALQRALAIEPRHLLALLQKASLLDLMGEPRAAAKTYHHALQTIPAGAQLPGSLRAPLRRAIEAVDANNAELEAFLNQRLQPIERQTQDANHDRVRHGLDALLGKRRIFNSQPTFFHVPKLPAEEFYPRELFGWLGEIEAGTAQIRAEFERVFAQDHARLEPYIAYPEGVPLDQWKELNHSRRWSVFYLWRDGKPIPEHIERCPQTVALLAKVPMVDIPNIGPTVFFSILDAHSHIPPHTGVTNSRLVAHVPLVIPPGCRFRVGADTREWRPGTAGVFDDTIEHEAWNDSDVPRAVLIFDIWNPYLCEAEREMVRAAVGGIREYYRGESPLAEGH
jgi:aspartate beta-hydroxylase